MARETPAGFSIRISSDPEATRIEQPQRDRSPQRTELPLRLMFVSDLTPAADESGVFEIDRNNFEAVFKRLSPRLLFEVEQRRHGRRDLVDVDLTFTSLDDFRPERVAQRLPFVSGLLGAVRVAGHIESGAVADASGIRKLLADESVDPEWHDPLLQLLSAEEKPSSVPRPASPPSSGGALSRLMDMVDFDEADTVSEPTKDAAGGASAGGFVDALMDAVTGRSERPRAERVAVTELFGELRETIEVRLRPVLTHPEFRRLEASWRGLKFLVDQINFRDGIELDVLPARRGQLDETIYRSVLMPEHARAGSRPPLSAMVLDFEFDSGVEDVALLEDLAGTGASLQIPILASAAPAFFGVTTSRGLEQLPPLAQHLSGPEWIPWRKLREQEESAHLALALPGVLARYPYGKDNPVAGIEFSEAEPLLLGGALVVAVAMAKSYSATGWPTRVSDPAYAVEGLPMRSDVAGAVPLSAVLSDERQADFANEGFVVIGCRLNRDAAFVTHAPTVHRPARYDDPEADAEARTHASLPGRIFASRAAQFLMVFEDEISAEPTGAAARSILASDIRDRLTRLMARAGGVVADDAVSVELVGPKGDGLAIRLRPPAAILDERLSVLMGIRLPPSD